MLAHAIAVTGNAIRRTPALRIRPQPPALQRAWTDLRSIQNQRGRLQRQSLLMRLLGGRLWIQTTTLLPELRLHHGSHSNLATRSLVYEMLRQERLRTTGHDLTLQSHFVPYVSDPFASRRPKCGASISDGGMLGEPPWSTSYVPRGSQKLLLTWSPAS